MKFCASFSKASFIMVSESEMSRSVEAEQENLKQSSQNARS